MSCSKFPSVNLLTKRDFDIHRSLSTNGSSDVQASDFRVQFNKTITSRKVPTKLHTMEFQIELDRVFS